MIPFTSRMMLQLLRKRPISLPPSLRQEIMLVVRMREPKRQQRYLSPSSSSSDLHGSGKGGVGAPEAVKFILFLTPALLYAAYYGQYGPSEDEISERVQKKYGKEVAAADSVYEYEKNIIAQAIYRPQAMDTTVDQFLKGGRYSATRQDLTGMAHNQDDKSSSSSLHSEENPSHDNETNNEENLEAKTMKPKKENQNKKKIKSEE